MFGVKKAELVSSDKKAKISREKKDKLIPILRWVGGKRGKIASTIKSIVETKLKGNDYTYYEPFAGGVSVLLELKPKKACINDINKEIINVYQTIKKDPDKLISFLKEMEGEHGKDPEGNYYKVRNELDREPKFSSSIDLIKRAARTIYLNRTCFNGVYRVNSKGKFNVPFGKIKSCQIDPKIIANLSSYLKGHDIKLNTKDILKSYRTFFKEVKIGDLVYFDPPYYHPQNKLYYKQNFGVKEHVELREIANWLVKKGVNVIISNTDCLHCRLISNIWSRKENNISYTIRKIDVSHTVAALATSRKKVTEFIIYNFPPKKE